MIDEAFQSFSQILGGMLSFTGDIFDEEKGIRFYIEEVTIESPVELDVFVDENGQVQIGTTPPLYAVDTTFRPSFHQLRFDAQRSEQSDGE